MVYIVVEINGFRQLKKINSNFADQILEHIESSFSGDEYKLVTRRNGVFIYAYLADKPDFSSILNNSINLFNYLKLNMEDLSGYTILLDHQSGDYTEEYSRTLLRRTFSTSEDEVFYITSECLPFFGPYAKFEPIDNLYKLVEYNNNLLESNENIISFLSQSEEMNQYLESLTPLINNDKKGLLYLYGKDVSGISILSYCISGILQGKTPKVPWLYIKPDRSIISSISPLINCMNNDFISKVTDYLTEPELSIWNDNSQFLQHPENIIFDEDAIILFRIYLKAYSLKMAELFMPAAVFILDSNEFMDITLNYIAVILEDLYMDLDLLPILFSEEKDLPAPFNGFQGKKFGLNPWILRPEEMEDPSSAGEPISVLSPVSFYHTRMLLRNRKEVFLDSDASNEVLKDLGHSSRQFLMIYTLFYDLCGKDEIISFLSLDLSDRLRNEKLYIDLVLNGFIYPDEMARPVFMEMNMNLPYKYTHDDRQLIDKIIVSIIDGAKGSKLLIFEKIAYIYKKLELYTDEARYLLEVIKSLILIGKTEKAIIFFERVSLLLRTELAGEKEIELKQNIYFLKMAIYENKDDFAEDVYLRLSKISSDNPVLNSERMIACSEYLYAMYKYKKGLDVAKLALIDIQDSQDNNLIAIVNLNLARILMGMERIDESKDYFKIAKEAAGIDVNNYSILEINAHEAVVNFIIGNFSESLRLVYQSRSICKNTGRRDWELFIIFLHGRILFELGDYSGAATIFSEGLCQCYIYFDGRRKEIFNIWYGRCCIYQKDIRYGLNILKDYEKFPEALLFSAEALFFLDELNNSFKKIDLAFNLERDRNRFFCSSNIISWESGYDFIEDRSLVVEGSHGVLFQLIRAFRAFLSAKLNHETEGKAELVRLMREERLSDIDPNNGYYYYLHALTFPEYTGAQSVDRLTLLSKALRHIQQTASHIDDPKHRQMYLSDNYWNSGLMEEGRIHKLI